MAYGANQELGWIEGWTNGRYRVSNYVAYKQDLENRKLEITLANQQCCSLDNYHTFHNNEGVNNGYGWQVMGGQVVDVNDAVNVPAGGCWTHSGDRYANVEVKYNDDGSVPDILMSTQFIAGINQYDTPEFDWTTKNIKTLFPSINAKVQAPTITNVDVISSTSATVEFTSVENATKYHITLKHQDGAATAYITTDTRYTFNHLSPNQNYTVTVQSEDVYGSRSDASDSYSFSTKINVGQVVGYDGNYGEYSGYYAFSITEEILDPPGGLSVVETTPTSATLSWDAVADATGYALYLYDESTTTQIKKISPITRLDYTITGLEPETWYSASLSSINSDGKEGEKTDIISFETTKLKNVKVLVNVNGVAKEGTMYTNVAGDSKKVIDIYFNVLGEAKEAISHE